MFDADPAFADRVRARVVALQAGDEATVTRWREIVAESELAFRVIYDRLGVLLEPADSAGESCYNAWLPDVVAELTAAGIAAQSDGALVVYSQEATGPDGNPVTLMVRKKDGGYGYGTTDLATIRYRIRDLKADRLLYVVDSRQALHFRRIVEAARRAGWLTDTIDVTHVAFGAVLGPDSRPFKTRSGDTVKLMDLLDARPARPPLRSIRPCPYTLWNGHLRLSWTHSATFWPTLAVSWNRTGSAVTCMNWPRRSLISTKPARCYPVPSV